MPGDYFQSIEMASTGILMPVKWVTAFTVNFPLSLGLLFLSVFKNNSSVFWESQNV